MEGPPLGPGGEDITWPDQVAPRGRKASSTRKFKPQTPNPKYKNAVVKFEGITTHMGLFAYVSGPHLGRMSDTTLAQKYRPLLRASDTLLADLAYLSVPNAYPR